MATGAVAAATTPLTTLHRRKLLVASSSPASLQLTRHRTSTSHLRLANPLLGSAHFSPWSGLKHLGISFRRNGECRGRRGGRMAYASLFGVGAPEALVIGVVALLVFGPKGLAEAARTLGKTLRAFQPTIRELQDVSREFKSTLEREIGLDEVQSSLKSTTKPSSSVIEEPPTPIDSNGAQTTTKPFTSADFLKITQEQTASDVSAFQTQAATSEDQIQDGAETTTKPLTSEDFLKLTQKQMLSSTNVGDTTTDGSGSTGETTNSSVSSQVTDINASNGDSVAVSEASPEIPNQEATSGVTLKPTSKDGKPEGVENS